MMMSRLPGMIYLLVCVDVRKRYLMPGVDGIFNLTACLISFQVLYIIIGVFLIMKN